MRAALRAVLARNNQDPDVAAYVARVGSVPDYYQARLDKRVKTIKAAFPWSRVKKLHFFDAPSQAMALVDIKNPALTGAIINSPVFVAGSHFAGDAVSANISFGLLGSLGVGQDSATVGVNVIGGTDAANSAAYAVGVSNNGALAILPRIASNVIAGRINHTTTTNFATTVATAYGRTMITRRGATDIEVFRDGASAGTAATASTALPGNAITLFRLNTLYSDFQIRELWVLDGVTAVEAAAFNAALAA